MTSIGILTTFRQPNFGSVLQAYALQCVVERLGYDAKIIDYKYPNEYHWRQGHRRGNPHLSLRWRLGIKKRRLLVALGLKRKNKMEMMNEFISEYSHINSSSSLMPSIILLITSHILCLIPYNLFIGIILYNFRILAFILTKINIKEIKHLCHFNCNIYVIIVKQSDGIIYE